MDSSESLVDLIINIQLEAAQACIWKTKESTRISSSSPGYLLCQWKDPFGALRPYQHFKLGPMDKMHSAHSRCEEIIVTDIVHFYILPWPKLVRPSPGPGDDRLFILSLPTQKFIPQTRGGLHLSNKSG